MLCTPCSKSRPLASENGAVAAAVVSRRLGVCGCGDACGCGCTRCSYCGCGCECARACSYIVVLVFIFAAATAARAGGRGVSGPSAYHVWNPV